MADSLSQSTGGDTAAAPGTREALGAGGTAHGPAIIDEGHRHAAGATGPGPAATAAAPGSGPGGEPEPETLVIRGRVRDSLGVALPRALVTLSGPGGGRRLAKTRSAENGAFSVTAPAQGDYLLAAFSPQLGSQSVTVRLAGRPVEVEFRIDVSP